MSDIRKIVKNGRNSYYINIPKELMKELRWKEKQKLVVKKHGKGVLVVDWEK
ncbi:MAG: AbrB/MazE/SpoVT family DNA-binding domain-containing protein [Patescibacteria group bacterium]|nr:AbrB/MazE/SpoVT family DNA-binding domain-containing protein [Patescibacteria group bacterium]